MKRKLSLMKNTAFIVLIVAVFCGCLKSSRETQTSCTYDSCALKAPASEIQAVQAYLSSQGITNAIQHCSGLFYTIDSAGTGRQPAVCSYVNVDYVGKFTNGTTFDSSKTTLSFQLNTVIPGWRNGLPYLKEGGKMHLYVPPTLGYGSQGWGPIPGNSILVFKVNLVKVP
jgi:FKBP-type peptidyl-prolyl cis-trans isomerase FkpA